jgi:hypothetical protein
MASERTGASRAGYVIALVIFLLGIVVSCVLVAFLIINIFNTDGERDRIVVPGSAELELEETGRYTIFYEYRSNVEGREFRTDETLPDLDIEVTSVETGERIPATSAFGSGIVFCESVLIVPIIVAITLVRHSRTHR